MRPRHWAREPLRLPVSDPWILLASDSNINMFDGATRQVASPVPLKRSNDALEGRRALEDNDGKEEVFFCRAAAGGALRYMCQGGKNASSPEVHSLHSLLSLYRVRNTGCAFKGSAAHCFPSSSGLTWGLRTRVTGKETFNEFVFP